MANLLSNAIKFSSQGGEVSVSLTQSVGWMRVEVKDDGVGIPDEFKDNIFGRFTQADASDTRKKGGTGLGLAISKSLVERMGGRIGFEKYGG